ncbi:MAG: hypothetical protein ACTHJK_05855 [Sphingomicrobium sp.]
MSGTDQAAHSSAHRRWMILTLISAAVIAAVILIEFVGPLTKFDLLGPVVIAACALNIFSWICRLALTKAWRRTWLKGRFPFLVGLAKLMAVLTVVILLLLLAIGVVTGGQSRETTIGAFILGLVLFAIVSLIGNGILNAVVVVRHFRGTLTRASQEQ